MAGTAHHSGIMMRGGQGLIGAAGLIHALPADPPPHRREEEESVQERDPRRQRQREKLEAMKKYLAQRCLHPLPFD
eukprot:COSAG01_NODE_2866_length_6949_cov_4.994599_10_plen_76_part_00